MGAVPAVAVLYTSRPATGDVMGLVALVAVRATRGGRNPLVLLFTSSCAEMLGVGVHIPTCANADKSIRLAAKDSRMDFIHVCIKRVRVSICRDVGVL